MVRAAPRTIFFRKSLFTTTGDPLDRSPRAVGHVEVTGLDFLDQAIEGFRDGMPHAIGWSLAAGR